MNKRTISVEEEQHEIREFLDFLDSCDSNIKEHYLKAFLLDKLDPRNKFIVSAYDYDNRIIKGGIEQDEFIGRNWNKFKLQIRLENSKDLEKLMNFLEHIAPTLKKISEEEDINDKRARVLKDIFEPDKFQTKKNIIW